MAQTVDEQKNAALMATNTKLLDDTSARARRRSKCCGRADVCAICEAFADMRTCGVCQKQVCADCIARPVLVSDQPSFFGVKNACTTCFNTRTADDFGRAYDVYPRSGGGDTDSAEDITVVLLHGATAGKGSVTHVAKTLAANYRVVVPDLPRHGSQLSIALTDASAIATVRRTIEDAVPGGRALVVGWSMGGWLALSFARSHPEMCLAVMAGGCYLDPTQASFAATATKMKSHVHRMDSMPLFRVRLAYFALKYFGLTPPLIADTIRNGVFYECWDEFWDMLASQDYVAAVRNCRIPLLLVTANQCTNNTDLQHFRQAMANNSDKHAASGVKEVAGQHVWLMNKADNVLEVLREFVKKL